MLEVNSGSQIEANEAAESKDRSGSDMLRDELLQSGASALHSVQSGETQSSANLPEIQFFDSVNPSNNPDRAESIDSMQESLPNTGSRPTLDANNRPIALNGAAISWNENDRITKFALNGETWHSDKRGFLVSTINGKVSELVNGGEVQLTHSGVRIVSGTGEVIVNHMIQGAKSSAAWQSMLER